jgi:hypothetical protein
MIEQLHFKRQISVILKPEFSYLDLAARISFNRPLIPVCFFSWSESECCTAIIETKYILLFLTSCEFSLGNTEGPFIFAMSGVQ